METSVIPNKYRTKNLMLLIGLNPLPNYVAARLLDNGETRLHLLVSDDVKEKEIPQRLLRLLGEKPEDQSFYIRIDPADPKNIYDQVFQRVSDNNGTWGLHYTGGKKSMSIHAYRGMETALKEKKEEGIYSYLDADSLKLVVDPQSGHPCCQYFDTYLDEPVSLWQLFYLHGQDEDIINQFKWDTYEEGYFRKHAVGDKIHRRPFQEEVCEALKNAWFDHRSEMEKWVRKNLFFNACNYFEDMFETPPQNEEKAREFVREALMGACEYDPLNEKSKSKIGNENKEKQRKKLETTILPEFIKGGVGGKSIGKISEEWGQTVGHTADWLKGTWLEHHVLAQVTATAKDCGINDYALGIESVIWRAENPKNEKFESDVLVMQGHRLFYISITTDSSKPINKSKLFEAYVRARQLGGEQAEVGLVCFIKDDQQLERELRDERSARVKVFGPKQLQFTKVFREKLTEWFNSP